MITVDQARQLRPEQRQQALTQVDGILAKKPKNVEALLSGAAIHYVSQRADNSIAYLKRAAKVLPDDPMIHQWLSVAAAEIRDFATAKPASAKLVKLDAKNPENWRIRGRILDSAGDPGNALPAFVRCKEIAGEDAELALNIANCHFYLGDLEQAEASYRRAIELDPSHALALYGLSTIHRFGENELDDYLAKIEAAVEANAKLPPYNTAALYYGAGKALDDTKQFDRAFAYYKRANETINPQKRHDYLRPFENARAAFNADRVEKWADWGDRSRRPIFVLGLPRSGTTLVESIIAAHPKVTAGGEMPVLPDIALRTGATQAPTAEFATTIGALARKDIAEMAQFYLKGVRTLTGKDNLITDKMPHNFMQIGLIFLMFPNAKVFHCRRDPIDNCVSIYTNAMTPAHNVYKTDLSVLGAYYRKYASLMDFWKELYPGKIVDVFYEDVVANTELNSRMLIEKVGLDWDDRVLARGAERNGGGEKGHGGEVVKTLSAWQVRQPIYASAMGKWKRYEAHLSPLIDALEDAPATYRETLNGLAAK